MDLNYYTVSKPKKYLAVGFLAGVIFMLLCIWGVHTYQRHVYWEGGMSPNRKLREITAIVNRYAILPFDRAEMIENMYRGFVAGMGDPYTQYLDHNAVQALRQRTDGTFVGIGVRVIMDPNDRMLTLVNVFRDSPAGQAGLLAGDKIMTVDGIDVIGRPQAEIVNMITGEAGTSVNIEIFRPYENRIFKVDIVRALVVVPTVFYEMIETEYGFTGYIRIEGFERPTAQQFGLAVEYLTASGMQSLIVDVRNNPGGLLESVVQITNMLVPEGVITYLEDSRGNREYRHANETYLGIPLALLINGRSASASEVLGGAVQDTGVGILIGEQSFGKGIVQNLHRLSDGTEIKLTIAQYFTPGGRFIHDTGLTPDIQIEMSAALSSRIGDLPLEEDVQLQAALRVLQVDR